MFEYLEIETTVINRPPRALFKIVCDVNNDKLIVSPLPKKNTQVLHCFLERTAINHNEFTSFNSCNCPRFHNISFLIFYNYYIKNFRKFQIIKKRNHAVPPSLFLKLPINCYIKLIGVIIDKLTRITYNTLTKTCLYD